VKFRLAFGGSGTQARAVIDGLPADIVSLALPLDIVKIQQAGLIQPGWEGKFPNRSSVCESVVSIVTRRGNPKNITGWEDLARYRRKKKSKKIMTPFFFFFLLQFIDNQHRVFVSTVCI